MNKSKWLFDDKPNVAVFSVRQVINKKLPILEVHHDIEDCSWQFLTGDFINMEDAVLVGLGEIVEIDHTIIQLADLPCGWKAKRTSVNSEWMREQK